MYKGQVEKHSAVEGFVGWCSYEDVASASAEPVQLYLYVGDTLLRRLDANQVRSDVAEQAGRPNAGFNLPFDEELLDIMPLGAVISLRDKNGHDVLLAGTEALDTIGSATDGGAALAERLKQGEFIDKWGSLKLPFSAKPHRRESYMIALEETVRIVRQQLDLTVVPAYGTLLGYARSGSFLEHDDDVDLAVMLPGTDVYEVAERFEHLVTSLLAEGHEIPSSKTGQFHFRPRGREDLPFMDIFAAWQTPDNCFHTYFGVSGQLSGKIRYTTGRLEGRDIRIPEQYAEILAMAYGDTWRVPDPNFQWQAPDQLRRVMTALEEAGAKVAASKLSAAAA